MNTTGNARGMIGLSAVRKEALASSLSSLGRFHNGEYVLNLHCVESIKEIIRFLRKDNESHEIRRYLGQAKVVQSDLIRIIKTCKPETKELFDLTIRLLTNLTCSVDVLYNDEIPAEKVGRNIYMSLIEHLQDYKEAFYDIDFWNVICGKLTDLFEIDWAERKESECLQIEKLLVLLRNVLHIPADPKREKITENDISVHDKILWSLRQSQILEFLLYVSSNKDEQRYYLHLLEIFSLILREQNPKLLALSEIQRSNLEREKDMKDLLALREKEKIHKNEYKHTRVFDSTVVLKGLKSFSGREMIYQGSLKNLAESVVVKDKKRGKPRNHKIPIQSEQVERRSSFSVRIFLKEFCIEFLNCSYNNLMSVVKEKLMSGKGLPNDETFYFWALKFFLEFNCTYNLNIKLISDSVNMYTFHFLQTNMDENFEKLITEKKKRALWVRKLHLILKAYQSLLQTLKWMDSSKDSSIREMSSVLKSQVFYIAEYRDMALSFLTRYDSDLFSVAYVRDMIETIHLAMKLLEDYTKHNKLVVRKKIRKKCGKKRRKQALRPEPVYESNEEKWDRIKDKIYEALNKEIEFPDVPPFDVLMEMSDEEQKEQTMKNIQRLLHQEKILDGMGLLRSARKVWPENNHFGNDGMPVEEEMMALQEICIAELGNEKIPVNIPAELEVDDNEEDEQDEEDVDEGEISGDELEDSYRVSEESFDMMSYKKQLVNKKVVEACTVLLQNYAKNSDYTNHCVIKVLFRIGWECGMPAMMYQISLFSTLLIIMSDKYKNYKEINDFTKHLVRKFTEHAMKNNFTFVELLFWKEPSVALEIQNQFETDTCGIDIATEVTKKGRKAASWSIEEEDELQRLWNECNPEFSTKKKVEWIKSNLIDNSKSLQGVRRKLKELGLIADLRSARINAGKDWLEEEIEELQRLFMESRDAIDIVSIISDRLTLKRTKKAIREKLLDLGLVKSISQLRKRNERRNRKVSDGADKSDSSDYSDSETEQAAPTYTIEEQEESLRKVLHLKTELEWLLDTIKDTLEEDDEETEAYPLLATDDAHVNALETDVFVDLMRKIGLEEPCEGQVYWRIPKKDRSALTQTMNLLSRAINDDIPVGDNGESEDEFGKLKMMLKNSSERTKDSIRKLRLGSDDIDNSHEAGAGMIISPTQNSSGDAIRIDDSDVEDDEFRNNSRKKMSKNRLKVSSDSESDSEAKSEVTDAEKEKSLSNLITSKVTKETSDSSDEEVIIRRETAVKKIGTNASSMESQSQSTKRRRRISSDSDELEDENGENSCLVKEKNEKINKRPRVRIIDSDSDMESSPHAIESG